MTATVEIDTVTVRFGGFTALDRVSLTIGAGRFAVLLGPSGCGKTTLLSILGGFLTPSEGRVMIDGRDITHLAPAKRPTTTMFQDYALFPHMSLRDNVGFGLRMRNVGRRDRNSKADTMLALVGLPDAGYKKPHELSGGQRQRVALARALAVEPEVLLLDEPLGALDLKLRRQMQDELKAIQRRVGTTFIHVTHDQEEAMAIADDIVVIDGGRIRGFGPPETIYLRPKNRFTAAFMGEANFIAGTVISRKDGRVTVRTRIGDHRLPASALIDEGIADGAPVELCFRPEHVSIGAQTGDLIDLGKAEIADTAFFGTHHRCHLKLEKLDEELITAHLPQTVRLGVGDTPVLMLDPEDIVILQAGGDR